MFFFDDLVTHLRACGGGVSEGDVPPQKLENCVFLELKLCNLVNNFRRKFKAGGEFKKKMLESFKNQPFLERNLFNFDCIFVKISQNIVNFSQHGG